MKRVLVLMALLAACMMGCGDSGAAQISPGRFTDRERSFVDALSENALVFQLGGGEYEAAVHCYSRGEWFDAGGMGWTSDGGGDLLFATQRSSGGGENLLPDTWTCAADGSVLTGYMEWPEDAAAGAALSQHCTETLAPEPGIEYMLAVGLYTDGGSISGMELGGDFAAGRADFARYETAWVFTVRIL